MKPSDLLSDTSLSDEDDPLVELERLLGGVSRDTTPGQKIAILNQASALLARAPLGSVDVFASSVRHKLGFVKGTLLEAVQRERSTRSAASLGATEKLEPTEDDTRAATALLRDPRLADRFVEDMASLGVVGEALNLQLLLLTVVSRLLTRPICVVLKSASSTGKSFLMNAVLSSLPPGECFVFTATSAKALYFRTDSLSHKVLVFMERPGAEDNDYQIRVLQSEGKLIYSVAQKDPETGEIVTVDKEIPGPVAYIETTTQAVLHDENETRLFSASLDESMEATTKILAEQGRRAAQSQDRDPGRVLNVWQTLHTMIEPASVVIPFAERIAACFPSRLVRARRDFPRFLSLIEASAVLHQCQRELDPRGTIVATLDDYAMARRLAVPLLESAIFGAGKKTRELIAVARAIVPADGELRSLSVTITASSLMKSLPKSGWSKTTVSRHLKAAERAGYFDLVHAQRGQDSEYRLANVDDEICLSLPDPNGLLTDADSTGVNQPRQGASNANDARNSHDSNRIVKVNQPDQGVRGQKRRFDKVTVSLLRDPDFV